MFHRIITITILFLLLVILIEIVYIFILPQNTSPLRSETNKTESIQNITETSPLPTSGNFQPAINHEVLDYFKKTRNTAHISSKISQQYKGVVHEISSQRYRNENGEIYNVYEIYLTDGNITDTNQMNSFIITDQVLGIANLLDQNTNDSFQISDLKKGDNITINHIIDLTKPSGNGVAYEKFEIIRSL